MILPALIDWHRLARAADVLKLTRGGCEWVSFASVAACLENGEHEDLALPNVVIRNRQTRAMETLPSPSRNIVCQGFTFSGSEGKSAPS